jgi:hypothetical protein
VEERHEARISVNGLNKDVLVVDADPSLNDELDEAYRNKYRGHPAQYVNMMVCAEARSTTIRLAPCSAGS